MIVTDNGLTQLAELTTGQNIYLKSIDTFLAS